MAGSGGNAPRVTGDQVPDTLFWPPMMHGVGYDSRAVDDLIHRVAAELDAGRPAGPVIENAAFRRRMWGRRYDIDAVDWFLGQFLLPRGRFELAGIGADPWGDLAVARLDLGGVSGLAKLGAPGKPSRGASRGYRAEQCENAWRDFGQLSGTHLCWGWAGGGGKELRTAEQETLAFAQRKTFSAGGRSFTLTDASARTTLPPGVAELFARAARDGQFAKRSRPGNRLEERFEERFAERFGHGPGQELRDETGTPILYTTGDNFAGRARAWIMFPDQRWLRFPVRAGGANAIMTAVDQAGNRVARYRILDKDLDPGQKTSFGLARSVEITVHPGRKLTDELALALAISAGWLGSYFDTGGG